MVVMAPKDEVELRDMLKTAVDWEHGPIALRYPRGNALGTETARPPVALPVGKAELIREGRDIAILAIGSRVITAENAAALLAERGVDAAVVNARFVKPLDEDLILRLARKTGAVVTIEENVAHGGFGSAVLELLAREGVQIPVQVIAIPDRIFDHASQDSLRKQAGIEVQDLVEAALELSTAVRAAPVGD
jgi:1-deoxy-D-xylulose-5-phosphate synthase